MAAKHQAFDNIAFKGDSQMDVSEKGSPPSDYKSDKTRRNREKCLLFFVVLFFLAIVALIVAVIVVAKKEDDDMKPQPEICLTPDCTQAAARLMRSMDTSVDPCDDFYTYSCGGWIQKNIIPEDRSRMSVFGLLADEVDVILKYLLEDEEGYKDVEAIQKAKAWFASCVDMDLINQKGLSVALPLLDELGGWPVLSGSNSSAQWNESAFDLVELLIMLRKYNHLPLMSMYVSSDVKDSDNRIIYVDSPGFGLPGRLYYLDPNIEEMREAYVTFATSVAVLFGADETTAEVEMRDMLELEIDLANISMAAEDARDAEALYNKMMISELKENFTEPSTSDEIQFDWFDYLSGIMNIDDVNVSINQSEYVVVRDVPYFQRLFLIVQKHGKRALTNYLIWSIVRSRTGYLDTSFLEIIDEYNKVIYGTQSASPRWKGCAGYVTERMGMAVGHMFVQEAFDETAKSATLEMIGNIRQAFRELLEEVDWMDGETKGLAREKMEAMRSWIGYPDEITQTDHINELYKDVVVDRQEYFESELNNLKRSAAFYLGKLREKYDKNEWTTPPSTVNAYYNSVLNRIMFPAGILQPPFYSKDQPQAMNYGGIGVVIGHEITHGFDDRGRQFDKDGNLVEWWEPEIIENFKQKAQCIIDQYGDFAVPEVNLTVNGINTQGENIADNGGLKQSYRAYRDWVDRRGSEEPTLPGLNFTGNQLFFINFGQIWCNNIRDAAMLNSIKNGVHSPGQFRTIGTLQNSRDFAQAFGCNKNHPMNPTKKCSVW